MVNLVPPQGGVRGRGRPALMSLYIGDNADCLTRGRLVCALCVILAYALPVSEARPMSALTVTLSLSSCACLCLPIGYSRVHRGGELPILKGG